MNKKIFSTIFMTLSLNLWAEDSVAFLKELVDIPSGSNQSANVSRVQDFVEIRLKKLGFKIDRQKDLASKDGDLLLGVLKGRESKFITLIVHTDTVFEPEAKFEGFKVSEDKLWATGPGVIDNKGGVVVLLKGLEDYLKKVQTPRYGLRVLSSPSEEIGSPAFVKNFKSYGDDALLVLSFEPSLDDGSIVTSRRGNRWFHFKTTGREAHAGRAFKDGVNACTEMSLIAGQIASLTNFNQDLTLNVGRLAGGQDKYNIVCGHAEMKVDTRFSSLQVRDEMQKQIDKIVLDSNQRQNKKGIKNATTYEVVDDSPPYSPEKETSKFVSIYVKQIFEVENKKVTAKSSGASADANYVARPGLVILDGLGPTGRDMHTNKESIYLPSLETRAQSFSKFMMALERP
jgi:glutamate carboxypeptidase